MTSERAGTSTAVVLFEPLPTGEGSIRRIRILLMIIEGRGCGAKSNNNNNICTIYDNVYEPIAFRYAVTAWSLLFLFVGAAQAALRNSFYSPSQVFLGSHNYRLTFIICALTNANTVPDVCTTRCIQNMPLKVFLFL